MLASDDIENVIKLRFGSDLEGGPVCASGLDGMCKRILEMLLKAMERHALEFVFGEGDRYARFLGIGDEIGKVMVVLAGQAVGQTPSPRQSLPSELFLDGIVGKDACSGIIKELTHMGQIRPETVLEGGSDELVFPGGGLFGPGGHLCENSMAYPDTELGTVPVRDRRGC